MPLLPFVRQAFIAGLALASFPLAAATVDTLTTPDVLMTVNGRAYGVRPVEMMLTVARTTKAEATLPQMLDSLVDDQLIAVQALKEYKKSALFGSTHVGFPAEIILEDQYTTLLRVCFRQELEAAVHAQPGGNLDSLIVKHIAADDPSLKELMTLRDMGEVKLTDKQLALAKKTPVATLRMPDGQATVLTFADIYARQHVQGRVKIVQEHDLGYLDSQIRAHGEALFAGWWAATKSGLTAADIALLKTMIEEKYIKQQYMTEVGVSSSMHEDTTPTLEKLQKQVTVNEIRDWYIKHKEEFRQIEKVRARHIECKSEADCNVAHDAIKKGMEFSDAAKKYSIAATRNATPAGSLGWIERRNNKTGWLGEVAMIGKQGQITGPIRAPADDQGNADWDLVITDERVEGYSPVDSDTVRYQARQEIAKRRAAEKFKAMHDRVTAAADIRRNAKLIESRAAIPAPTGAKTL